MFSSRLELKSTYKAMMYVLKIKSIGLYICTCIIMTILPLQKERRTALMFAAKNGIFSIVQLLLKFKPDINIKDSVSYHNIYYY